jgi:hypothetical protein
MDPTLQNAVRSLGQASGLISMLAGTHPDDKELAKAAAAVTTAYGIVSERRQAEITAEHSAAMRREAEERTALAAMAADRERMLH